MALIWWTDQKAAEIVQSMVVGGERPTNSWPAYLEKQFAMRLGRPGRGRLWDAGGFGDTKLDECVFNSPLGRWLGLMAGIVIHNHHLDMVVGLPGVVTDVDLQRAP